MFLLDIVAIDHRFLTGVPWTHKGSVGRVFGVRKDHTSKVLYPFKPVLKVVKGPPIVHFDSLGVRGNFFDF